MGVFVQSVGVVISSGSTVSAAVPIGNAALMGLMIPDLTSLYTITAQVAVSFDAASSQYMPIYKADGSGLWSTGSMIGNRAFVLSPDFHAFEALRFVSSPAQIGDKNFVVSTRQL